MKRHEFKEKTLVQTGKFITLYDSDGVAITRRIYSTEAEARSEFDRQTALLAGMDY